ncbi:excinuclease ABC subunit UvrC [Ihubacter massiliensis]|uniref:UvrABC system protein C n=1 Tax=Hominibacterium faecale TaxID=2839743 RepID=A0A9J6QTX1_9FIRM|nr:MULTISPECIES: excinuclease ABC subunit UvrC [Eubacteriales Family XIII. Incertae Sedis]MCO7123473.1 excinuclease ABC subunit UvrC [Ihubacter massiliensis]MCU7379613.1 excinuclease ABC subunit UvrC [Hominibacterium faecale]
MFDIQENLKKLPDSPGVYLHKDKLGQVIYVGKAISLKNRVRQYFQSSRHMDPKVRAMVSQIEEFEYITTGSEMEALILECNLIKKHMPKYNVLLRDDKTYPYIKVTMEEDYPRVIKTRLVKKDGSKYFGPYSDAGAVNQIVDLLNQVYSLKKCSARVFPKGFRPCLNYHIDQCDGICQGTVSPEIYREKVNHAVDFLRGRTKGMLTYLEEQMAEASQALDFERAAEYRDYIMAAKALSEKQRVVLQDTKDVDLILVARGAKQRHVVLFFVRDGKLSGRETYDLQSMEEDSSEDIISAFIKQHYSQSLSLPKEIILEKEPEEKELLKEYLSGLAGHQVHLLAPKKGEKRAVLELAKKDVVEMVKTIDQRAEVRKERAVSLGKEIFDILIQMGYEEGQYNGRDYRVEAYDISNTNGVDTVGAMVVFEGLKADKKSYRRFKVRSIEGPNDYGSMQEVLFRRFRRALEGDEGFSVFPDLILIDGGKGHVNAALEMIRGLELDLAVAGMAKDDHHRTRSLVFFKEGRMEEILLKDHPLLYKYMGTVQEEVHRFAIEYHRGLRNKRMLTSVLDEIEGIGPAKRNALLDHFGSVDRIKSATQEQLQEVKGITEKLAIKIQEYFHC